ncbi:MAG TPA: BC1881 family protein [Falsiroseomonas sp.]|jgi:hypothetical protein|nr:BC1881 family protein [Falsiroseomonas sp.]
MSGDAKVAEPAVEALRAVPTCDLQWELERREGVQAFILGPDTQVEITVDGVRRYSGQGPMTVTVNID